MGELQQVAGVQFLVWESDDLGSVCLLAGNADELLLHTVAGGFRPQMDGTHKLSGYPTLLLLNPALVSISGAHGTMDRPQIIDAEVH